MKRNPRKVRPSLALILPFIYPFTLPLTPPLSLPFLPQLEKELKKKSGHPSYNCYTITAQMDEIVS